VAGEKWYWGRGGRRDQVWDDLKRRKRGAVTEIVLQLNVERGRVEGCGISIGQCVDEKTEGR
jgi:hypothetical protein